MHVYRYEGEWHNNKKHGYGVTTLRDGTKEEGKYKYNVLITSQKKKHLFLMRSAKFRERIDAAVSSSQRASKYALQKADIAVSRTATARSKGEMADSVADHARVDSEIAVATAREFAPDFKPSVLDRFERLRVRERYRAPNEPPTLAHVKQQSIAQISSHTTPNHLPTDNRTQASTDSTPQKQQSFPQAPTRRQSMLQKQASIDYAGVLPQHTLQPNNQNTEPQQYPSKQQYQEQPTQFGGYGNQNQNQNPNQNQSNSSNYTAPNQNYYQSQPNSSHYTNTNYAPPAKYPSNLMHVQSFGATQIDLNDHPLQTSQYNTQMQQQPQQNFNAMHQSGYQNYDLGNQQSNSDYPATQQYGQQVQQSSYDQTNYSHQDLPGPSNLRRNSRQVNDTSRAPHIGSFSQSSIDHYDHYKRPPSRDSSVDRYARAASRLSGSRQPSIDRSILPPTNNSNPSHNATADTGSTDRNARAGSAFRNMASVAMTPATPTVSGNTSEFSLRFRLDICYTLVE